MGDLTPSLPWVGPLIGKLVSVHEPEVLALAEHADQLQPHEADFVANMRGRLVCGGEPTPRQANWLKALYAKFGGEE